MTLRIPLLNRRPNRSVCILNSEKKSASSVRDLFGVPSSDRFESRARPLRTVLFCDRTNFDIKFGHETQEPGMLHCLRPKQRRDFPPYLSIGRSGIRTTKNPLHGGSANDATPGVQQVLSTASTTSIDLIGDDRAPLKAPVRTLVRVSWVRPHNSQQNQEEKWTDRRDG